MTAPTTAPTISLLPRGATADAGASHRLAEPADALPRTVPVPRFPGMPWPGEGEVAHVPAALVLAARGECSCDACCERFVHMLRRRRLRAV